jgi:hypothetical protein
LGVDDGKGEEDFFGKLVADNTVNTADIASHYSYNPQRWRLYKTSFDASNRLQPEYNTVSEYKHAAGYHELKPGAGETVILQTNERFRYVVSYELIATFALKINQSLTGDDKVRCGFYDGADGWFLEHNGGHAPREIDLVELRGGTETYRETLDLSANLVDQQTRLGMRTGWYDITPQKITQSAPSNGDLNKVKIGGASQDTGRGPRVGNQPLRYEVTADANTSDLVFEPGSCALQVQGNGLPTLRVKNDRFSESLSSTNTFEPVRAFRIDPDRYEIYTEVTGLSVLSFGGSDEIDISIQAMSSDNVTFTGTDSWTTPPEWNSTNNPIETRNDVDQIPANDGTLGTTQTNPGGYQLAFATLTPTNAQQFQRGTTDTQSDKKTVLNEQDYAVVLIRSPSTGDSDYLPRFEMDF